MGRHLGDYDPGAVVTGKFSTPRHSSGEPYTLAGSPALAVYKDSSDAESSAGVTLSVDFDGRAGLHHFSIDTDNAFYSSGSCFDVVLIAGTVDGVSVAGLVVGSFTLRKTSTVAPLAAIQGRTDYLPAATAGAAGGLLIAGANAGASFDSFYVSGTAEIVEMLVSDGMSIGGLSIVKTGEAAVQIVSFDANAISVSSSGGHALRLAASGGGMHDLRLAGSGTVSLGAVELKAIVEGIAGDLSDVDDKLGAPAGASLAADIADAAQAEAAASAAIESALAELENGQSALADLVSMVGYTVEHGGAATASLAASLASIEATVSSEGVAISPAHYAYFARIAVVRDGSTDRYTVQWFRNSVPLAGPQDSPTGPALVILDPVGAAVLFSEAMLSDASSGIFYLEKSDDLLEIGKTYTAVAVATIDGANRNWRELLSIGSAPETED